MLSLRMSNIHNHKLAKLMQNKACIISKHTSPIEFDFYLCLCLVRIEEIFIFEFWEGKK